MISNLLKLSITIFAFIFSSLYLTAQHNLETGDLIDLNENLKNVGSAVQTSGNYAAGTAYDNRFKGTKGSPFLFQEWRLGNINMIGFREYQNIPIKYDANQNKVWIMFPNDSSVFILEPELIASFSITNFNQNQTFIPIAPKNFEDLPNHTTFYEVLYSNNSILIKKENKEFRASTQTGPYASGNSYNEYVSEIKYYLKLEDEDLFKEVKLNSRKLKKQLPGKVAKKLVEFENKMDQKIKSENQLIYFLEFLN